MTAYVVQAGSVTATSGTALSGTLSAAVRAGNCVVVIAGSSSGPGAAGVTLAGLADNFSKVQTVSSGTANPSLSWWADPSCAGGGSVVAVTYSATAPALNAWILEVGGLAPTVATVFDTGGGTVSGSGTAWGSGTIASSYGPEMLIGAVQPGASPGTVRPPGFPWIPLGTVGASVPLEAGYQVTPNPGTVTYQGTFTASATWAAGVAGLIALPAAPSLPAYVAGSGPQQGDMSALVTSPLGFWQQRTVFRATQSTSTTTLPAGTPGTTETIAFDTILEDPYQGWSASTHSWTAPYTGWYQITADISVGTSTAGTTLTLVSDDGQTYGGLFLPAANGNVHGTFFEYLTAGQGAASVRAFIVASAGNVTTSNNPPSTVEITWVAGAA